MKYVGKLRLNESISLKVKDKFARFFKLPGFDIFEIFDASSPNDPSPPCKAAAVIHRTVEGEFIHIDSAVFDYNNRDFHKSQLFRIVDQIANDWFQDISITGTQITINRPENGSKWNKSMVDVFSKSNALAGMKIFAIWNFFTYYAFFPLAKKTIAGNISVIVKKGWTLHAILNTIDNDIVSVSHYKEQMHGLMQQHGCFKGILYFDKIPISDDFTHAFTITYRGVKPKKFTLTEFIV